MVSWRRWASRSTLHLLRLTHLPWNSTRVRGLLNFFGFSELEWRLCIDCRFDSITAVIFFFINNCCFYFPTQNYFYVSLDNSSFIFLSWQQQFFLSPQIIIVLYFSQDNVVYFVFLSIQLFSSNNGCFYLHRHLLIFKLSPDNACFVVSP